MSLRAISMELSKMVPETWERKGIEGKKNYE